MDNGGQYAVLGLTLLMLTLSAGNWDMTPTQCSIHHRTLCSFDLLKIIMGIDILIPVSLYGVGICIIHQVIDALVLGTVAHPVQLLAVLITIMSLLYVVSVYNIVLLKIILFIIIGEQHSSTKYTTTLSTCSGLC